MTTCVPVQFDQGNWETAVFFEVGGKHCSDDRKILRKTCSPLPVSIEADLINHANASVVTLRFEVMTRHDNPLVGEVLLAPGIGDTQFDTLKNLSSQHNMRWYFGDGTYNVIHSQQTTLCEHERQGYESILQDAVRHDAVVRLTGRYDAKRAFSEIVSHYAYRS